MIKIENLYRATNEGLDIILHYYPQAREVVGTKNKFRVRRPTKRPRPASTCATHRAARACGR